MAKLPSFADMAKMKVDDLPKVKPLPPGHYYVEGYKQMSQKPTRAGRGFMLNFMAKIIGPIDDFENPELLEDYQKEMGSPAGQVRTVGFYWPEQPNTDTGQTEDDIKSMRTRTMNDMVRFLSEHCGLEGDTFEEMAAAYPGARFILEIQHEIDDRDPTKVRENTGRTMPIES